MTGGLYATTDVCIDHNPCVDNPCQNDVDDRNICVESDGSIGHTCTCEASNFVAILSDTECAPQCARHSFSAGVIGRSGGSNGACADETQLYATQVCDI